MIECVTSNIIIILKNISKIAHMLVYVSIVCFPKVSQNMYIYEMLD